MADEPIIPHPLEGVEIPPPSAGHGGFWRLTTQPRIISETEVEVDKAVIVQPKSPTPEVVPKKSDASG